MTDLDRPVGPAPRNGLLAARVTDQFFRRWLLYLLPVILLGGLGFVGAMREAPEYQSIGRLSATANPLLDQTPTREEISLFEAPASGVARLINERLGTDVFLDEVARRAGIGQLVTDGIVPRDVLRQQVGASEDGSNVLSIAAFWEDPETASLLVQATVSTYLDVVSDAIAKDSDDAIALLESQRELLSARVSRAEERLATYLDENPAPLLAGADRPVEEELAIDRLNSDISAATQSLGELDDRISAAELSERQAQSDAGRSVVVVDPPVVADEPEPMLFGQILRFFMFLTLGVLVAASALGAVVYLDRSVRLEAQVETIMPSGTVVSVPVLRGMSNGGRRGGKRTKRPPVDTPELEKVAS